MAPAGDNFVSMKALYDAPIVFAVCVGATQLAKAKGEQRWFREQEQSGKKEVVPMI